MGLNLRHFSRQIPARTLESFLASFGHELSSEGSSDKSSNRIADALFKYVRDLPRERGDLIYAAAERIHDLACERSRKAILNAAEDQQLVASIFCSLNNDHERAAWAYLFDPQLFQAAEELHYFDHHAEGALGCSYRGPKRLGVSRDQLDLNAFESRLQHFFRQRDGSGRSCVAEVADRHVDQSVQVTIYLEALPSEAPEFVNGTIGRRMAYPVIEAAVVYSPVDGTTTTVARGGKDVHEALRAAFAEQLLKTLPIFDRVQPRRNRLQELLHPLDFPTDPAHGIERVRVRRLKLIPSDRVSGALVIEAPAGRPDVSVYDLSQRWLGTSRVLTPAFAVAQATICLHFRLPEGRRRAKALNVELSMPNRSNLRNLGDADRTLVEHYLNRWDLLEPAA